MRKRIEDRLAARIPPLPLTEAFPMADVIRVVEKLFERNRFDYNLADSESDLPEGNDDSDTSEDESESEDEDKPYVKTSKRTKKKKRTSRYSSEEEEDLVAPARQAHKTHKPISKEITGKKQPVDKHTGQEDVEQIIRQLGKLSLDDPKYGLLYYRAIKLDTTVAQCVAPPVTARVAVKNNNAFRPTFPNSVPLAPPAVPAQTKAPTFFFLNQQFITRCSNAVRGKPYKQSTAYGYIKNARLRGNCSPDVALSSGDEPRLREARARERQEMLGAQAPPQTSPGSTREPSPTCTAHTQECSRS